MGSKTKRRMAANSQDEDGGQQASTNSGNPGGDDDKKESENQIQSISTNTGNDDAVTTTTTNTTISILIDHDSTPVGEQEGKNVEKGEEFVSKAAAPSMITQAELDKVIKRLERGFKKVNAKLAEMDLGLLAVTEVNERIQEKVSKLESSVKALEDTSMEAIQNQLALERQLEDIQISASAEEEAGIAEDCPADATKPRRPIRRNNTIGAPPHEAAKYRVSFEDDLRKQVSNAVPHAATSSSSITAVAPASLSAPSSPNLIPTPPGSEITLTPVVSEDEEDEEEEEKEIEETRKKRFLANRLGPMAFLAPGGIIQRSKSVSDVSSTGSGTSATAPLATAAVAAKPPPAPQSQAGSPSLSYGSRLKSPFGSLKKREKVGGSEHAFVAPVVLSGNVPMRSKSLKETSSSSNSGAKVKTKNNYRFSWASSSSNNSASVDDYHHPPPHSSQRKKSSGIGSSLSSLSSSINDLHAFGGGGGSVKSATSSNSLFFDSEDKRVSPGAAASYKEVLTSGSKILKSGLLDLRKTTGFKAYKTYWCLLTDEANFYLFSSSLGHREYDRPDAKAKQVWNLTAGAAATAAASSPSSVNSCSSPVQGNSSKQWTLKIVSADGKEVKKTDKRTRYFALTPPPPPTADVGESSSHHHEEMTTKQFQASSKEEAALWTKPIREVLLRSVLAAGNHQIDEADYYLKVHEGGGAVATELATTPIDKEFVASFESLECDPEYLVVAHEENR